MKTEFESWLAQIPPETGIVASVVWFPDSDCCMQSHSEHISLAGFRAIWSNVAETMNALANGSLPARRLAWQYGQHRLQVTMRSDGLVMGLLVSRESNPLTQNAVQYLFQEFEGMQMQQAA